MAKRGRPRKPRTAEQQEDLRRALELSNGPSGPFGYKWQSVVARRFGERVCKIYNLTRLNGMCAGFRYLFDGLSILTDSRGVPAEKRLGNKVVWMDGDASEARASGQFSLWGTSVPADICSSLLPNNDGASFHLYPFGRGSYEWVLVPSGKAAKLEEMDSLHVVKNNDIDATLTFLVREAVTPARAGEYLGKGIAGLSNSAENVRYLGKPEIREMRAIVHIACLTTRYGIYLLKQRGKMGETEADRIWSLGAFGAWSVETVMSVAERNGGFDGFWHKFEAMHGKDRANQLRRDGTLGELIPLGEKLAGPEYKALALFLAYLIARYRSCATHFYGGGTIRLCQRNGCQNPAFIWSPPKEGVGYKKIRGIPMPKLYCVKCERFKDSDRKERSRKRRTRKRS